jgi:hypothetical protein
MTDFREQLFLAHLQTGVPAVRPKYVQEQAEECCEAWGHDYVRADAGHFGMLPPLPQTIGGTPVVSDFKCRRCGRERHPAEKT